MNFRISFILMVLVAVVGGYVLIFELQRQSEESPWTGPWFYDVGFEDITSISVTYREQRQAFVRKEQGWIFEDTGEPVNLERWGGIPLLLSGPRSTRLLAEQIDNPAEYGLDPPQSHITVGIKGGRQISILLGNKTPDGASYYGQVADSAPLFLILGSWGDIINRLVTEPPMLPTPTLEATPTAGG